MTAVQLTLWTRYELSQVYGPSAPRQTKIRPCPGRQTWTNVDQHNRLHRPRTSRSEGVRDRKTQVRAAGWQTYGV